MPDMLVGHAAGGGIHGGLQGATRVLPGVPLPTLWRPGLRLAGLWFVLSRGLIARRSVSAATLLEADRVARASRSERCPLMSLPWEIRVPTSWAHSGLANDGRLRFVESLSRFPEMHECTVAGLNEAGESGEKKRAVARKFMHDSFIMRRRREWILANAVCRGV